MPLDSCHWHGKQAVTHAQVVTYQQLLACLRIRHRWYHQVAAFLSAARRLLAALRAHSFCSYYIRHLCLTAVQSAAVYRLKTLLNNHAHSKIYDVYYTICSICKLCILFSLLCSVNVLLQQGSTHAACKIQGNSLAQLRDTLATTIHQ